VCGLSVEALKRDGVNKRSNALMDKSFDGMHEKYDFDSIRCLVKKTISISMIVTSVLLHSVNLILFTVLLVHLVLRISPHHSHHLRSHHLSLPLHFTPDLKVKTHLFHKSFPPQLFLFLLDCLHRCRTYTELMWAVAFVCVLISFFHTFFSGCMC